VNDFAVCGVSYGTVHAMAVAQHYGPARVLAMGLRVPYFGLPLSTELGLPDGQLRFPTTDELRGNSLEVQRWRYAMTDMFGLPHEPGTVALDYPEAVQTLMAANAEPAAKTHAALIRDYPDTAQAMANNSISVDASMYMMARDVALDLPGLDPRNIEHSGNTVVVWYAADDEDCPPSHGEWLAKHFRAKTRIFDGYGHLGGGLIDHPLFLEALTTR